MRIPGLASPQPSAELQFLTIWPPKRPPTSVIPTHLTRSSIAFLDHNCQAFSTLQWQLGASNKKRGRTRVLGRLATSITELMSKPSLSAHKTLTMSTVSVVNRRSCAIWPSLGLLNSNLTSAPRSRRSKPSVKATARKTVRMGWVQAMKCLKTALTPWLTWPSLLTLSQQTA